MDTLLQVYKMCICCGTDYANIVGCRERYTWMEWNVHFVCEVKAFLFDLDQAMQ